MILSMAYLLDTNILLRFLKPHTQMCQEAQSAIRNLLLAGENLYLTPQNLIEFWNGATRPIENNGFGLSPLEAEREVNGLLRLFPLLAENSGIFPQWRQIVLSAGVIGAQVHDARLAAVMNVHGISHILTFNVRHLGRFAVQAVHPRDIPPLTGATSPANSNS